jgi:hypothetical protein
MNDAAEPTGPAHPTGTEQAAAASAAGRAHAEAMRAWAQCVAEAASGPKTVGAPVPPKLACGEKPMGPGRARHLAALPEAATTNPAPPRCVRSTSRAADMATDAAEPGRAKEVTEKS